MGSIYELSLSRDYVRDWNINDALRELFQNAIDQQQISGKIFTYDYDAETKTLRIINPEAWLDRATLLLGETSKEDVSETVGQFGEGYKLACLVLCRLGKKVSIENRNYSEVWTANLRKSRRYNNKEILVFDINGKLKFKHTTDKELVFVVEGLSRLEWESYQPFNLSVSGEGELIETVWGNILLDPERKGDIFSGGLYVGTMEDLHYGYNFNPSEIPLDRDRKALPTFDILYATSKMWRGETSDRVLQLFEEDAPDVKYSSKPEILKEESKKEEIVKKFYEKQGQNSYPVSNAQELETLKRSAPELKPVLVGKSYRNLLVETGKIKNLDLPEKSSVTSRLNSWLEKVRDKLTDDEVEEFKEIIKYVWN